MAIEPSGQAASLEQVAFATEYRSGERDLAREFFARALRQSHRYDRAVGYFRSSVFLVIGDAFVRFVRSGGQARFVCSPELTREDLEALATGHAKRDELLSRRLEESVQQMLSQVELKGPSEFLATLVEVGVLELRVAVRPPGHGIYHEKIGIFEDRNGAKVSFKGSANETWRGWHGRGNLESIEVFCSWTSDTDAARVDKHREYFDRLWRGEVPTLDVLPFPEAARRRLCTVARQSLDEAIQGLHSELGGLDSSKGRVLLPHQQLTIENWSRSGCRGIAKHATGSGKTFMALMVIRDHVAADRPALVLVPSRLLLEQWMEEIRQEIPEAVLLVAGGGYSQWRKPGRLEAHTSGNAGLGGRIVLSTMQTAAKKEFRARVNQGPHLLLVVDEVHQLGSRENSKTMTLDSGPRLGLSATPERFGDPEGTAKLLEYFQGVLEPTVSLSDAIAAGRLVEYVYSPHAVHLTPKEAAEWTEFTEKLRLEVARYSSKDDSEFFLSERAKLLLIKRARIAKKASAKTDLAVKILEAEYEEEQRWLVYCEDISQLHEVQRALNAVGIPSMEYYSEMTGDREGTLSWLRSFGGVVVSIRCLDEGVDIPEVSHALILASSQNPRQFIQRRGRVLRRAEGKHLARVFDALVVPPPDALAEDQISLAGTELKRALIFAQGALNREAEARVRAFAAEVGIDLDAVDHAFEDEDQDIESENDRKSDRGGLEA